MVHTCVVIGCKKESYPGCGLTFHRFPQNEDLKNKWMEALQISRSLSKHSVVCSLHFKEEDFLTQAKKRLKPDTIPYILPKILLFQDCRKKQLIGSITLVTSEQTEPGASGDPPSKKLKSDISTQTEELSKSITELRRTVKILNQQLKRRDVKIEKLKHVLNLYKNKRSHREDD